MPSVELVQGELCRRIVGSFYQVFNELGSGFLEGAYQRAMQIALEDEGISSQRDVPTTVYFRGRSIGEYRMDLVVADSVVIECKIAEKVMPSHRVQLLNYLRATNHTLGVILNFGSTPTFKRIVNETSRRR